MLWAIYWATIFAFVFANFCLAVFLLLRANAKIKILRVRVELLENSVDRYSNENEKIAGFLIAERNKTSALENSVDQYSDESEKIAGFLIAERNKTFVLEKLVSQIRSQNEAMATELQNRGITWGSL